MPSLCVFHPIWVFWSEGGLPRGPGHNLLIQFSGLGSSKMDISETDLFDTLTIQNDQVSDVKHVSTPLYVFFIFFGVLTGGLPKGLGHNLPMGTYGGLWGPMGAYGDLWGPMGACGDL